MRGRAAAARRALDEAALEQVGLVDVLDGVGLLVDGDGERREPDGPSPEAGADDLEDRAVEPVEPLVVDLLQLERGVVTAEAADRALALLEVDDLGLDRLDRDVLSAICERFDGGPVGLSTLAVAVGEEQDTIEDVYEPYLLQQGFLKRTPRGRVATPAAFRHLGLDPVTLI